MKLYPLIFICLLFSCTNTKKHTSATNDVDKNTALLGIDNIRLIFGESTPIQVGKQSLDSILNTLAAGDSYIFTDLYPIIDTLPNLIDDSFILIDKLENLGYSYVKGTGGRGNYQYGPRFGHATYEKDSIQCDVYKAFQYHQLQKDSTYSLLPYEQIECRRK